MTDNDPHSEFTAGDREEIENAERDAVLKKAELLEWAYERQAAQRRAEHEARCPSESRRRHGDHNIRERCE